MPGAAERIIFGRAELSDQGRLGPLLLEVYGPALAPENLAAGLARLPVSSLEDELMAADDFYFSSIGLMDCCWLARDGEELAGAACVNPFVGELHYIAVRPAWRRLGIGRKLAELALGELVRRNCDHVRIEASLSLADAGGRAFAERLGFRPIRRVETFGMPLPAPGPDNPEPSVTAPLPAPASPARRLSGGNGRGTIET